MSSKLIESIKVHEGYRDTAYKDSVGVWTIGYGTNLETLKIHQTMAEELLEIEVARLFEYFDNYAPYNTIESQVRRDIIIEMAYNLGIPGLLKFKATWAAIAAKDWQKAHDQMLASKWASQVGQRAVTLADRMLKGVY
jgi:lysozyme